ncbi:MAG: hypothetical protein K0R37_1578, partial [Arthrobacter sp.]|nr:hypothetical protein [Arthrobacter sp.]
PSRNRARAVWAALAAVAVIADVWLPLPPSPELLPINVPGTAEAVTSPGATEPGAPEPGATGSRAGGPVPAAVPAAVRHQLQSPDPVQAVKGLAALRSFALGQGRLELLREVNAGNSPAAAADARISARLQESRSVLEGFSTTLSGIRLLPESTKERAVVAVTAGTAG